jgi:tetratricopeptide (TPR) repeat protein
VTRCAAALALVMGFALAAGPDGGVAAQENRLDRVDALVAAGAYADARTTLSGWWDSREAAGAGGAERARALMLRARLAPDPASAEADYLAIVLGYPISPDAPQALLRLGQGLLAMDEPTRAVGYLKRLVADYPGRPERATGLLWLGRAQTAARQLADACDTYREGLRDGADPAVLAMLRAEEPVACAARPAPRGAMTPAPATPPAPTAPAPAPSATAGRYAIQAGAFRQQPGVDALTARLRRAGHEPRTVRVPASDLTRVRIGRFESQAEAARLLARLRAQGFDVIIVTDADQERNP